MIRREKPRSKGPTDPRDQNYTIGQRVLPSMREYETIGRVQLRKRTKHHPRRPYYYTRTILMVNNG